jgi:hypothetical protein
MHCMKMEVRLGELLRSLEGILENDSQWRPLLRSAPGVHLAVLVEPFLTYILQKRKTVESRFSMNKIAPFMRVLPGDLILLKKSAGPVLGLVRVEHSEFLVLDAEKWSKVRSLSEAICADGDFWHTRAAKRYATLLHLGPVRRLHVDIHKVDRRPWVVLRDPRERTLSLTACA